MKKIKYCLYPAGVILAFFLVIEMLIFAFAPVDTSASEKVPMGNFKLTFYCPCRKCSGSYGYSTSSGARATEGRTIAVDPKVIPKGSRVYIEGYGEFVAEDTGGKWVKGNHIDIFLEDHDRCIDKAHGVKHAEVYILK